MQYLFTYDGASYESHGRACFFARMRAIFDFSGRGSLLRESYRGGPDHQAVGEEIRISFDSNTPLPLEDLQQCTRLCQNSWLMALHWTQTRTCAFLGDYARGPPVHRGKSARSSLIVVSLPYILYRQIISTTVHSL